MLQLPAASTLPAGASSKRRASAGTAKEPQRKKGKFSAGAAGGAGSQYAATCMEVVEERPTATDSSKLFLSEAASDRLQEVFKLGGEVTEVLDAKEEATVVMETNQSEARKMPELYYYM
jgi:hypothetical protein